jgi:transposase
MYVRKKKNPSGKVSVQVIDKSRGKYKLIKTLGSSSDPQVVQKLVEQGKGWISNYLGHQDLFKLKVEEELELNQAEYFLSSIENVSINGGQLLFEKVYKSIGFDAVNDDILKYLVMARLSQPLSKLASVEYIKSYYDEDIQLHKIYRYMDKLYNTQQDKIQQISVAHTQKILGNEIGLLFYDVTTLYFETDKTDELRETGFSKEGKHSHPQIVLGLLVSKAGYPLSYSIFNGSQFEGRTMLPIIEDFISRFKLKNFVVVADSGMMNNTNIMLLEHSNYKYIIGARIKNENKVIKEWILSLKKDNGAFYEMKKETNRLIVSYSEKRAKKDKSNREKGIKRLKDAFKNGKLTKEKINNRGYNKFLEIKDKIEVIINEAKIKEDEEWDGLKGYVTNTDLSMQDVYDQYSALWIIEKAFRVTKSTLETRPIFHFSPRRIEAHICICFVAYKVYKELERIVGIYCDNLSIDKVVKIAKTITTIKLRLPQSQKLITKTMLLTDNQRSIAHMLDDNFWNEI